MLSRHNVLRYNYKLSLVDRSLHKKAFKGHTLTDHMLGAYSSKAAAFEERQAEGTGLGSVTARMWRRMFLEDEFQQRQPDAPSVPTPPKLYRCNVSVCSDATNSDNRRTFFCDIGPCVEDKSLKVSSLAKADQTAICAAVYAVGAALRTASA